MHGPERAMVAKPMPLPRAVTAEFLEQRERTSDDLQGPFRHTEGFAGCSNSLGNISKTCAGTVTASNCQALFGLQEWNVWSHTTEF